MWLISGYQDQANSASEALPGVKPRPTQPQPIPYPYLASDPNLSKGKLLDLPPEGCQGGSLGH